ncbi:MAG: hypothetical protein VKJ46_07695 [Leptolyngbyaceae bacterium]|nr:hypothetical protein [Leptolyngbyaceae bacterium]
MAMPCPYRTEFTAQFPVVRISPFFIGRFDPMNPGVDRLPRHLGSPVDYGCDRIQNRPMPEVFD